MDNVLVVENIGKGGNVGKAAVNEKSNVVSVELESTILINQEKAIVLTVQEDSRKFCLKQSSINGEDDKLLKCTYEEDRCSNNCSLLTIMDLSKNAIITKI